MSQDKRAIHYDPADSLDEHGRLRVANGEVLSPWQCVAAIVVVAVVSIVVPWLWASKEPLEIGGDYRVRNRLSEDYWHVRRASGKAVADYPAIALGDSVVWGRFAYRDGTLTHFINEQAGRPVIANLGLNGMQPATLRGLVWYYGDAVRDTHVLVNFNPLWTQDAFRDLSIERLGEKQTLQLNHAELTLHTIPEIYMETKRYELTETAGLSLPTFGFDFVPDIPTYRPEFERVMSKLMDRNVPFASWTGHLKLVCYEGKSIQQWMLDNPKKNPFGPVEPGLPERDFAIDGEYPPDSGEAAPWIYRRGLKDGGFSYEWVPLETSHQWRAFRDTVETLRARGNTVFVLVGPFNVHMLDEANRPVYRDRLEAIAAWLDAQGIPHAAPEPLPSEQYADSSHPSKSGYRELAKRLMANEAFRAWLEEARSKRNR